MSTTSATNHVTNQSDAADVFADFETWLNEPVIEETSPTPPAVETFEERASLVTQYGIPVIPLLPRQKKAVLEDWPAFATTDSDQIAKWNKENPNYNCAAVGQKNGFWFFEVDRPELYARIAKETTHSLDELDTVRVKSSGEKRHYYFKHDARSEGLGNFDADDEQGELFSVRAHNKYVVSPGSVHPKTGQPYEIIHEPIFGELPIAPDWLMDWLLAQKAKTTGGTKTAAPIPEIIPEHSRNKTLTSLAGSMRRRGANKEEILAALQVMNRRCRPPLDDSELETIAGSVASYPPGTPVATVPIEVTTNDKVQILTDERPDMPKSILVGRLGEICEQNLLTDFPVAYGWLSLVTAASVLVPEQENGNLHNLYTALIGPINIGKTQCIEWAVKSLRVSDSSRRYSEVKPGSAERLLKYMNRLQEKGELAPQVLMSLDEWKFFFDKAGIENSSFATLLTTGFYKRDTRILDSHGRPLNVPAAFSWIGGIVTEVYDECFSRVTALGLYDRFLQGVNPSNYQKFDYRPFTGEQLPVDFEPSNVAIDKSVWERLKEWRDCNPQATREAELALRVAVICASFDKAAILFAKDLEPHLVLADEQKKLRQMFKPNTGETPDAQCAIRVENYLQAHGGAGEWLDFRTMMKAIHYERFGPNAFDRTIRGLVGLKIAELGERAPESEPLRYGGKPGRPAKVIRLVLE